MMFKKELNISLGVLKTFIYLLGSYLASQVFVVEQAYENRSANVILISK